MSRRPLTRVWLYSTLVGSSTMLAAWATWAATGDRALDTFAGMTLGKVFTFLLLTLGPFNVVGPFAELTRAFDAVSKRRLALQGILIAALGLFVAATLGVVTLSSWGVSPPALFITVGILLFLVGLRVVLRQYDHLRSESARVDPGSQSISKLAFSPVAFPTIVTPYGIAVLTLAMALASEETAGEWEIGAVVLLILAVDLVVMLTAERIMKAPMVVAAFGIVGVVMAVLQVALSVQSVITGLRIMGLIPGGYV